MQTLHKGSWDFRYVTSYLQLAPVCLVVYLWVASQWLAQNGSPRPFLLTSKRWLSWISITCASRVYVRQRIVLASYNIFQILAAAILQDKLFWTGTDRVQARVYSTCARALHYTGTCWVVCELKYFLNLCAAGEHGWTGMNPSVCTASQCFVSG